MTCREQSRADPTLAANTYTSPTSDPGPSVDNLTKNIYSQVGSLISAQVYCNCLHSLEMDTWQLSGKNPSKPSSPASLLDSTWQPGSQWTPGTKSSRKCQRTSRYSINFFVPNIYLPRKPWRHRASPLTMNHEVLAAAGQQQGPSRAPRGCRQLYRC